MKLRIGVVPFVALVGALLAGTPAHAENKSDLEAMRQRISALKKDIEAAESSQHEAADALRASETAISDSKRELRALEARRARLLARLAMLRTEQQNLESAIERHGRHIEQMLRQQYVFGQADALKLLLNGEDPNTLARHAGYYGYLSRARAEHIGKARSDIARLEKLLREREVERGKLDEVRAGELKEQQALRAQRAERRNTLSTLETRISQQRKEYTRLKRDEQRLSELVVRLARLPRKPEPKPAAPKPGGKPETNESLPDASLLGRAFARLKGQLALPVRGEILHRYGSSREDSGVSWKGVFIRAPQGESVHAVAAGEVVFADWLRGFGNLVIVDHGGDYLSLYSHNESLYKQVGERVKPGDVIASVGASGGNPETGLYFELRHRGRPFDPMGWTRRK